MANQVYGRLDGGGIYFIFDKIMIAKRHEDCRLGKISKTGVCFQYFSKL